MKYNELAKQLYKTVLSEYNNRSNWDKRSLSIMLNKYLKHFNEEAQELIEKQVYNNLNMDYFTAGKVPLVATSVELSAMLYKNAKETNKKVTKILRDGNKAKETIKNISMKIYDGYNSNVDLLDVKRDLPKYLKENRNALKQINKLKDTPLKYSYKKVLSKMDDINSKGLEKALYVALEERARYYATRIAKTEAHRSNMVSRAKEYQNDNELKYVRFEMSSGHPVTDICDFYASIDVGLGRGVIPKSEMRVLPLHPHCYDKETEVYTNKGWLYFDELQGDEQFLSIVPKTKMLEFVKAKKLIKWHNTEDMFHFKHKHFDLLVTDKHNMLVYKRIMKNRVRQLKEMFITADKCNNKEFKIPRTAKFNGLNIDLIKIDKLSFKSDDFVKFMGWWLSDGSVVKRSDNSYFITIAQKELKHKKKFKKVIENMGLNPYIAKGYLGFNNTELGKYLMQFGKAQDKFIPSEIKDLDSKLQWEFLKAFVSCDGSIRASKEYKGYKTKEEYVFYSSSKRMADDIGEMLLKCGYQPSFYLQNSKGKEVKFKNGTYTINHNVWIVRLKRSEFANVSNLEISKVKYNNFVYCVELEKNHTLWIRRNGKTCFSGNCHCVYTAYYKADDKKPTKSFKVATSEAMSKFNSFEKKQILGSQEKLNDFLNGDDIEGIFNRVRPKYKIEKYSNVM